MPNTLENTRTMRADFGEIPGLQAGGRYKVDNAWTGKCLGSIKDGINLHVESHDTAVLLVQEGCGSCIGGGYGKHNVHAKREWRWW